jgi:hypothetical protein
MELLYLPLVTIGVLMILGVVLRIAIRLLLLRAYKRQQAALLEQQHQLALALAAAQTQAPPPGAQPGPLPPIGTGVRTTDIYMPGGPAVVNGQLIVPGVGHTWKR